MYLITEFFHSLPHLNMWFIKSNATFDLNDSEYLETILFWTTVPLLILIVILLLLIIYACSLVFINNTYSIKSNQNFLLESKNKNLWKLKGIVWFFSCILCIALGILVFGSENFHYSFSNIAKNANNFTDYFTSISNQTKMVQHSINNQLNTTLNKFENDLRKSNISNFKLKNDALKEINNIKLVLYESYKSLDYLKNFDHEKSAYFKIFQQTKLFEKTRWIVMIAVVTVNVFLIFMLMFGLIKNSKASLCFYAFAGVLSLITIWVLNAIYLGVAVFSADYCFFPDQFILSITEKVKIKNLLQYLTTCQFQSNNNKYGNAINKFLPFKHDLNRAESKLRTAYELYNENLVRISKSIVGEDLIKSYNFTNVIPTIENHIDVLRSSTNCDQTSKSYEAALKTICFDSMFSLAIILGSSVLFGLIMPILICIVPQMWRRMSNSSYYESGNNFNTNVNETYPFLHQNVGNSQFHSNASVSRRFNDSPNFQRSASISRNGATLQQAENVSKRNNSTISHAINDYVANSDPYIAIKEEPSAPPNYNFEYTANSTNVPIVLYGNRTLSSGNKLYYDESLNRNLQR